PNLGRLRIAKLLDILRMAVITVIAFFHSEVFQYQRPSYADFAKDTVNYYYNFFIREIQNPNSIVLIVEDSFKKEERDYVYGALKDIYPSVENADSIIVGIRIISLPEGSNQSGQFQPEGKCCQGPLEVPNLKRDQSEEALSLYSKYTNLAKLRY
ncbi:hypothetical protein V2W45_1190566, partial [Cenococcum geophilum]